MVKLNLNTFKKYDGFLKPIISKGLDDNLRESLYLDFNKSRAYFFGDEDMGIEGVFNFTFETDEEITPENFAVYVDKIFVLASKYDSLEIRDGIFYDDKDNKFDIQTNFNEEVYELLDFDNLEVDTFEEVVLDNGIDIYEELSNALEYADPYTFSNKHGVFFKDNLVCAITQDTIAYLSKLDIKSPNISIFNDLCRYILKSKGQDIKLYKETLKKQISDYTKEYVYYYVYLDDDFIMRVQNNINLHLEDEVSYEFFANKINATVKVNASDLDSTLSFLERLYLKSSVYKFIYMIVEDGNLTFKIDMDGLQAENSIPIIDSMNVENYKSYLSIEHLKKAIRFLKGEKEVSIGFFIDEENEDSINLVYFINKDNDKMTIIYELDESN
jgi:hypothetical protein